MNSMLRQKRKDIVCRILCRLRDDKSVAERAVKDDLPELYRLALACFGSWQNALAHAGVEDRAPRALENDGEACVLHNIRQLCHAGRCLKARSVKHHHFALYASALRHFGTWAEALDAAGINTEQFNANPQWDRARILEALLLRAVENRALGSTTVRPRSLKRAAVEEFGSWKQALIAAGLNPREFIGRKRPRGRKEPSRQMWNRTRIIKAIRQRELLGLPLDRNSVCRDNRSLATAARVYFGDWLTALDAAQVESLCSCPATLPSTVDGPDEDGRPVLFFGN